eukprot:4502728-Prymnesium_polylepis.2
MPQETDGCSGAIGSSACCRRARWRASRPEHRGSGVGPSWACGALSKLLRVCCRTRTRHTDPHADSDTRPAEAEPM